MIERIRYHLDEHVDPDIARALRRFGIDVTTTPEAGLRTRSDDAQIEHIRATGRIIVTNDTDYLVFAAANSDHPGIAYYSQGLRSMGQIIRSLVLIWEVLTPDEMRGRVEYL